MNTYYALLAEFGTAHIPLSRCHGKFGLSADEAMKRAGRQALPVPAFRLGSQKSEWLIDAMDLAKLIDSQREKAADDWRRIHGDAA